MEHPCGEGKEGWNPDPGTYILIMCQGTVGVEKECLGELFLQQTSPDTLEMTLKHICESQCQVHSEKS